jgi:hypothetical protein
LKVFDRLLHRLTYANVVATLALFVALGGSAYAVTKIGSKQVKNRSLKGVDVRRNTLGGKEVNESKLGRVRRAGTANQAQQAANAINAVSAGLANLANNSQALGGQQPAFFEKSSRTQFARASGSPPDPASEGTLLQWDALGLLVKAPQQGACSTSEQLTLRIQNNRASGGPPLLLTRETGDALSISPGAGSTTACSGEAGHDGHWQGVAGYAGEGPTLFFECQRLSDEVRCLSTRSEP